MIVMITLDDIFSNIWERDGEALFSSKYPEQLFIFEKRHLNSLPVLALGLYRGLHLHRPASLLEIVGICRKVADKSNFDILLLFRFIRKLNLRSEELLAHFGQKAKRLLCEIPSSEIQAIQQDIFRR